MYIEIKEVQEIIKNLESGGELSIKEEKYPKVAKLCVQLAAENAALKSKGKELLGEACAVYSRLNKIIDPSIGDFVDGQTLHEFQFVLNAETPATDRIVAGIKADGVEAFAESQKEYVRQHRNEMDQVLRAAYAGSAVDAERFAKQLSEGADK
jgi:hypothetical protein|nr:MAG TPA: hypothetical protein [Caudoviricetes sp.]